MSLVKILNKSWNQRLRRLRTGALPKERPRRRRPEGVITV